jgi:hypothetical protein
VTAVPAVFFFIMTEILGTHGHLSNFRAPSPLRAARGSHPG